MALTPEESSALSRLLDEALLLPAAEHEAWLARLPPPEQVHVPRLRSSSASSSKRLSAEMSSGVRAMDGWIATFAARTA